MTEIKLIDVARGPRVVVLELDGAVIHRQFGRLDAPGKRRQQAYFDAEEAELALASSIEQLRRTGYVFPGERELMLAAIEREPDVLDHYQVYADWLIAHANPHGELIQLMIAASQQPEDAGLSAAISQLMTTHKFQLGVYRSRVLKAVEWRWGFVHCVEFEVGTFTPRIAVGERQTLLPPASDQAPAADHRGVVPDLPPHYLLTQLGQRLLTLRTHPCWRALCRLRDGDGEFEIIVDGRDIALHRLPPA